MRRSLFVIVLLIALAVAAQDPCDNPTAAHQAPISVRNAFVPGQLLVKFRPEVGKETGETFLKTILPFLPSGAPASGGAFRYAFGRFDPRELQNRIELAPGAARFVEYAEPNYLVTIFAIEDPLRPCECGLDRIHAEAGWANAQYASDVTVAIADTGVDETHPDLDLPVIPGAPPDVNGHGTHLAGIVAAMADRVGIIGAVGPTTRIKLLALACIGSNGTGNADDAAKAIRDAIAAGARVILCSWGTPTNSRHLEAAVNDANNADVVLVTASGNNGLDIDKLGNAVYPASYGYPNIISVMATRCDPNDSVMGPSNYGRKSVDLAAPGTWVNGREILSTVLAHGYGYLPGTSMAAAFAAAAAALVRSDHPAWSAKEVRQHLIDTAEKRPSLKRKCVSEGRLDLRNAVKGTRSPPAPPEPFLRRFLRFLGVT